MKPLKFRLSVFVMMLIFGSGGFAKDITICTDSNNWYPFTFETSGVAKGMHVDIATAALKDLGYNPIFKPLPWKRCLLEVKEGKWDALVSGSYKPDRAEYLAYPADAATSKESAFRLMQVSYIVVSHIDDSYQFAGDLNTLPAPIRAPLGYSIVDDLKAQKLEVVTTSRSAESLWSLVKSKRGVFITTPLNAKMFNKSETFAGQLKIHQVPITSKSYFILFPKVDAAIAEEEKAKIWNAVVKFRDDETFMEKLSEAYP